MADFETSTTSLVADVDCTTGGQSLCEKVGVRGYPTIKYGDPSDLQDYNGGRSYDELKKFADENLGPTCGPGENLVHCDAETKAKMEKYVTMSVGKLEGRMRNMVKNYEVELPIMKKVMAYMQNQGAEGKGEL